MKYWILLLALLPLALPAVELEGTLSEWKGFERYDFQVDGRDCHIVKPARSMAGNPWVWRARFPNWHTEVDELLLAKGYHVAYMNVANLFGAPKATQHWDAFYAHMAEKGFAEKAVIEGVSRGGLISLNWAKRNPGKVACIYLEAPVCDITSWPGGKGIGVGAAKEWALAQQAYDTNENGLVSWDDNPIDNLDALATAKVPIYAAIGLQDKIVPPAENSYVLFDRYIQQGGPFTLHPMTQGRQELEGHHFPIETPEKIVDFMVSHSAPNRQKEWFKLRGGMENARLVFERTGKGRVAFLGGSITYNKGWRPMVCEELQRRFPNTEFEFVAAGIPSTGSPMGAFRLQRDVLKGGRVDLLFEEAAVNDTAIGHPGSEQLRAMEGIVRHARERNPNMDVVLMHFVDPEKIKTYNEGKSPTVIENHERIARHYNIPSINLALEVTDRINRGEFTWKDDFKNLHPSPFGQKLYFNTIKRLFDAVWPGVPAEDDKISAYELPPKLNDDCYHQGNLFPPTAAHKLEGFQLDPKWENTVGGNTRAGFVDVPMLVGERSGDNFLLSFTGRAVGLLVIAGPDAGIIECRIDEGEWIQKDLYTRWSGGLHIPRIYMLNSGLKETEHLLEVRTSSSKNKNSKGHACRIVNFAINGTFQ